MFQISIEASWDMQVRKIGALFQSAEVTVLAWLHLLLLDLYQARQSISSLSLAIHTCLLPIIT